MKESGLEIIILIVLFLIYSRLGGIKDDLKIADEKIGTVSGQVQTLQLRLGLGY